MISLVEKLIVNKDYKLFSMSKNVNDVFEEFRKMSDVHQNTSSKNFSCLTGLVHLVYDFTGRIDPDEKGYIRSHIINNFDNKIFEVANKCKEYTWWTQDDMDLDDNLYEKMREIHDNDDLRDMYDELAVPISTSSSGRGIHSTIIIEGYANEEWVVFLLFDDEDDYMRGFIIYKL